jgi:hypothetical protein
MQTVVESGDKSVEHEKPVEQVCGIKVRKTGHLFGHPDRYARFPARK